LVIGLCYSGADLVVQVEDIKSEAPFTRYSHYSVIQLNLTNAIMPNSVKYTTELIIYGAL